MLTTQSPAAVRVACADDGSPRRLIWGGRRLTGHKVRQHFLYPMRRKATAGGFTKRPGLHTFRHSHAAHMLANGVPIHELSWRLGHSSIQVTIDTYGHLVTSRQGAASRIFAESMGYLHSPDQPAQLTP